MTQIREAINGAEYLTNVEALSDQIEMLTSRRDGLPGMGVFFGPAGYGKTYAATYAATEHDAIHIGVQKRWTIKTLLKAILHELGLNQSGSIPDMLQRANQGLAAANRPLLIDEAGYAIARGLVEDIRDLYDGSLVPVILIGMEQLPQQLRKWDQINSRVLNWTAAQPATLEDAQILAAKYAPDVAIADDLLTFLLNHNTGNARLTSRHLSYVEEQASIWGLKTIDLAKWGKTPLPDIDPPVVRSYLK